MFELKVIDEERIGLKLVDYEVKGLVLQLHLTVKDRQVFSYSSEISIFENNKQYNYSLHIHSNNSILLSHPLSSLQASKITIQLLVQ